MQTLFRRLRELFAVSTNRLILLGLFTFLFPFLQFISFEQPKYPSIFTIGERPYYDWKLQRRPTAPPSSTVAIIGIGNRSLLKLGRWPFSRTLQAQLLDRLREAKVRVVAFDLLFAEPETNPLRTRLASDLRSSAGLPNDWQRRLESMLRESNADSRLADSVDKDLPIILGYRFNIFDWNSDLQSTFAFRDLNEDQMRDQRERRHELRQYALPAELGPRINAYRLRDLIFTGSEPTLPIFSLMERLSAHRRPLKYGFFNATTDSDGVVRQSVLLAHYDGKIVPSLPLAAAALYLNPNESPRAMIGKESRNFGIESLTIRDASGKNRAIPVDNLGLAWVNYAGPPASIPTYEFVDVLEGKVPQEELTGKVLFVGVTEGTLGDNKATPFSESFPGVEIHANIADSIIHENYLVKGSFHLWFGLILLTIGAFGFGSLIHRLSPIGATITALLCIAGLITLDLQFFFPRGFIVPILWASLQYATIYVLLIVQKLISAENDKRFVELAFSRFVSRSVAEQILRNRSQLKVGGEKRELTVLFSDIEGFTELAERTDAKVVTEYLNDFFSVMTKVILANRGTLDKYIGDAIMCFWGAPLQDLRHAEMACRAAIAMQDALKEFNLRWETKLNFETKIRIGINSGEMAVGNMGSDQIFDYTVLGDNVNVASRLEGINKEYGTHVLVGQQTFRQCSDRFLFRPLDRIEIRGRNQIEEIYELIALRDTPNLNTEWVETFARARSAYLQGQWESAEAAFRVVSSLRPGDTVAPIYIERIQNLKLRPAANWDGVWRRGKVSG